MITTGGTTLIWFSFIHSMKKRVILLYMTIQVRNTQRQNNHQPSKTTFCLIISLFFSHATCVLSWCLILWCVCALCFSQAMIMTGPSLRMTWWVVALGQVSVSFKSQISAQCSCSEGIIPSLLWCPPSSTGRALCMTLVLKILICNQPLPPGLHLIHHPFAPCILKAYC